MSRIRLRLRFARASAFAVLLAVGAIESAAAQSAPPFEGLGILPGFDFSEANAVSADGSVVVGYSEIGSGAAHAVRWADGVMTYLGTLGGSDSVAYAVSANGGVVVGTSHTAYGAGNQVYHAFRWENGTMTDLGTLNGHSTGISQGYGVSANGNVVVGQSTGGSGPGSGGPHAFRWVKDGIGSNGGGTMTDLGTLGGYYSWARGLSSDGNVVVGGSRIDPTNISSEQHAFRWVAGATGGVAGNSQMYDLGTLGGLMSDAYATSANGNVVVGKSLLASNNYYHAFRWVGGATGGVAGNLQMYDLGTLGGNVSYALGVSADGGKVVGYSEIAGGDDRAFLWTEADGMKSVQDLLTAAGTNLTGWALEYGIDISADGNVIVGSGTNPDGTLEAWIARLTFNGGGGIITETEVARSFASLGALGRTGNAALGATLSTMSQYATQSMDNNACNAQDCPRYSVFAVAGYDSDPSGFGKLGLTMRLDEEGLVGGALIGADYIRTDMYADGEATMRGGSAGLFVARAPEAGLQWLVGLSGLTISGDVDRGYHNGNTPTTSRGNTTGNGYGIEARAGWTYDQLVSKTKITPFASYTFSSIRYDGYTESGGPFPASFAAFTDEMQTTRLGMDVRYTLAPGNWVWGTVAWGHRFKGDGPEISGQLIDLFGMSVPGLTTDADWLEATAGLRMPVSKAAAFTASASVTVPEHQQESYVFRAGLSQAF